MIAIRAKMKEQINKHPTIAWVSIAAVGGLLYIKVWLPLTGVGVPCAIRELTGFYCPGCGITRAAQSLLEGELYQGLRYNALWLVLLPLYVLYVLARKKQLHKTSKAVFSIMIALAVLYGIMRNMPGYAWLAPVAIG
ncbi:DUF2752 domain-containing protein [Paenibacillus sp. GCM10027627]|uniref:DUF2752 domain-containing protein n=1 Tax=unclassified Paenibacillus TaxID=185978 RepID=UPI00362F8259